jgi:hypothetical protein
VYGKNVLRKGVNARRSSVAARGDTARLARQRTMSISAKGSAPLAAPSKSKWVVFQPAETKHLSATARELAKERLRAALREHFMFRSCTPEQSEQIVRAMRHRIVRAGQVRVCAHAAPVHKQPRGAAAAHMHMHTQPRQRRATSGSGAHPAAAHSRRGRSPCARARHVAGAARRRLSLPSADAERIWCG